ncbi:hypothetical protein ACHWQZ_G000159 [Mnemiopsis leidyi]
MTFKKFELTVDNPAGIYYSGQLVTGKVLIDSVKDKQIDCVSLHVSGEACVYWCENEGKRDGKKTIHYQSREPYFNQNFLLLGYSKGFVIKSGTHVFPFKFQLPQNLPSTFEGEHGSIRYKLRCSIQRSSKRKFPDADLDINVISLFNLNIVTAASKPLFVTRCLQVPGDEHTRQGTVSVCLSTLKSGFVPGETILVTAEIRNCSPRVIKKIGLQLVSVETYKSKLRSTTCRKVLSITRYENCKVYPGHFLQWNDVCLVVPQRLPPSGLPCCSIIKIKYLLEVTFKPSGSVPVISSSYDVILGTIPLKQRFPVMRRTRTYEKLSSSAEDICENISSTGTKFRPRSKSISCRSEPNAMRDADQTKKPLVRLNFGSEPHVARMQQTKKIMSGSESDLNNRTMLRSGINNTPPQRPSRTKSCQHLAESRVASTEPAKTDSRQQIGGENSGSNSSSGSDGVYDRYRRRRSKGGEGVDTSGYVTILEREEENDMLRVLESGAWDEETFSKLLMSS